jgi:hypothetical protein
MIYREKKSIEEKKLEQEMHARTDEAEPQSREDGKGTYR